MKFSEKLLRLRKEKNMTQDDLAEFLDVSRQAISRWELGTVIPDVQKVCEISELFNVSTDYLLFEDDRTCSSDKKAPAAAFSKSTKNVLFRLTFSPEDGSVFLYSRDSISMEQACSCVISEDFWNKLAAVIARYVAYLMGTEEEFVVVTLRDDLDKKKCAPLDGFSHYDREFRINFDISHINGQESEIFDSFRMDVDRTLSLSFFKRGSYIYHTIPTTATLNDIGLEEDVCLKLSAELLEMLNPGHEIVLSRHFGSKVYSDLSGGFHLRYLVK